MEHKAIFTCNISNGKYTRATGHQTTNIPNIEEIKTKFEQKRKGNHRGSLRQTKN